MPATPPIPGTLEHTYGLTNREGQIVRRLMAANGNAVHREQLMTTLYGGEPANPPHIKILDVFTSKARTKLAEFGLSIHAKWGVGYFMTPSDIQQIREALGEDDEFRAAVALVRRMAESVSEEPARALNMLLERVSPS